MGNRFEEYVGAELCRLTKSKREALLKKCEEEDEKFYAKWKKYYGIICDEYRKVVGRVLKIAKRDGLPVRNLSDVSGDRLMPEECPLKELFGAAKEYRNGAWVYPEGSEARRAYDALRDFDECLSMAKTRLVVYKKDLGMAPEAFEDRLAKAALELNAPGPDGK